MGKKYVCIVDRGTTNTKAVLFDLNGNEVCVYRKSSQRPAVLKPGWFEQDMNGIWESAAGAVRGCVRQLNPADEIIGVSVTGQGGGLFPADASGNPVRQGVASLDTRAEYLMQQFEEDGTKDWWIKHSGGSLLASCPQVMLRWMKENEPEAYEATEHILFSKDWVRYRLTGEYASDITDASPPGLLGRDEKSWFYEGFDRLGIQDKKEALPKLIPSYERAGGVTEEAAEQTGLRPGTPVFTGAHDMMACCMGIGSVKDDYLLSLIGTWGANYMVTDVRRKGMSNPHIVPGYYITGYLDGNSGAVLDLILQMMYERPGKTFAAGAYYDEAEQRAKAAKHRDLVFLPYLFGSPYHSEYTGIFANLKNWHKGEDILAAVYEGIVMCHYNNTMAELEDAPKIQKLYLGGGGGKSGLFAQLFADLFDKPVYIPAGCELTARGSALGVLAGLGIRKTIEEALIPIETAKVYEPRRESQKLLQEKYIQYLNWKERMSR